jgi:hypothetical protein
VFLSNIYMHNKTVNTILLIVLFSSIIICGGRAVFNVIAASSDILAPELINIIISPSTVSPGSYFSATMVARDNNSGIKSANIIIESPSGKFLHSESASADSSGNWKTYMLMPSNSELGTWKVKSVRLEDNSGNTVAFYYDNVYVFIVASNSNTTPQTSSFVTCGSFEYGNWSACQKTRIQNRSIISSSPSNCIGGNLVLTQSCTYTSQCSSTRPYLDVQSKENCVSSRGVWDESSCVCTCSDGWHIETTGTSCIENTSSTTPPATTPIVEKPACVSSDYSSWSLCVGNSQTKTLLPTANCTGEAILTQACGESIIIVDPVPQPTETSCTGRETIDKSNGEVCAESGGTWTDKCICTCPSGYSPNGSGCVSTNINIENPLCETIEYSPWVDCIGGLKTRKVLQKLPDGCIGGIKEDIEEECVSPTSCTSVNEWNCGEWSTCLNKVQKRTCTANPDCSTISSESPKTEQACVSQPVNCTYTYTNYGACDASGKQYREVKTSLPVGCIETTKDTVKTCDSCVYYYTKWSSCNDKKQTRTVSSKYPENCYGNPVLEQSCETPESKISDECIKIGWTNESDCEIYTYREKLISDCKSNNLTTFDACREYIINEFGKPTKCEEINGASCDNLINNVILSSFNDTVSAQTREQLFGYAGNSGTIDPQQQLITVQIDATSTEPAKTEEVKAEELPLASSNSGQILISLLPISNVSPQESLSPVGIAFDNDGDGLPDDMEQRLGTDPNKKDTDGDGVDDNVELKNGTNPLDPLSKTTTIVLSGIDKAIVDGKTLEQPKLDTLAASESLTVNSVETIKTNEKSNLKFQGKAKPNQVITLYIYSAMPIVVTVQSDSNGNWVYELDKTLVDGTHEAYVAINNDEGKILEASLPTPFFIAQAQAVSVDNFVSTGDASQVEDKTNGMMILYVLGGLVVIFVLTAAILIIRQKYSE